MRNPTLCELAEAFVKEATFTLDACVGSGEEIPFEVVETAAGRSPLYCYRPLMETFIRAHLPQLTALTSYGPVADALVGTGGLEFYLRVGGEQPATDDPGQLALAVLAGVLGRVFDGCATFSFPDQSFAAAYDELERVIYGGRCVTEVVTSVHGVDLDPRTQELRIGHGLALVRASTLSQAPDELVTARQPSLLLLLRVAHERGTAPTAAFARAQFHTVLTALRLFERGAPTLAAIGYARTDGGAWAPLTLGFNGHARQLALIGPDREQELLDFCALVARRISRARATVGPDSSGAGELAWALSRFEMACERSVAFDALSDYLLALRALLEPEGASSGRLAQRLSAICATPAGRARLAERTAMAVALERAVIAGIAQVTAETEALVDELAENLRAILRDLLCGHLDREICVLADRLLAETLTEVPLAV